MQTDILNSIFHLDIPNEAFFQIMRDSSNNNKDNIKNTLNLYGAFKKKKHFTW